MKKKSEALIIGVFLMLFLSTGSVVQAQNLTPLEIIDLLLALEIIPAEKAELARNALAGRETNKTSTACLQLHHSLYLGISDRETSGEVSKLQRFLKETGHYSYG